MHCNRGLKIRKVSFEIIRNLYEELEVEVVYQVLKLTAVSTDQKY